MATSFTHNPYWFKKFPAHTGIGIVAPSGYALDEARLQRAIQFLQQHGFNVINYYDSAQKYQRFGGDDETRIAQLHAAASHPDIQIVLGLRGGYGLSRLLPRLDFERLAASKKFFVGYSDFTALHLALLACTGMVSFAGPMVSDDLMHEEPHAFTLQHFAACLTQLDYTVVASASNNPLIDFEGTLWGGNLAILTHLTGTPYMPKIEGGILFIEDINEHPYRIERMILQLHYAGIIKRQQAVLLGDFSGYRLSEHDNGYDFAAMLAYLRRQLPVPLITGLPFGHIADKVTLPVGAQARLTTTDSGWRLVMRGYPLLNAISANCAD